MKIAYLDCFSGISGDMLLAALLDAGVPLQVLEDAVTALGLGARLRLSRVNRSGIDAARIEVLTADGRLAEEASASPSHASADHRHEHPHGHSHHAAEAGDGGPGHTHGSEAGPGQEHSHGRSLPVIQTLIRQSGLEPAVQEIALRAFQLLGHAEAKIHNVPVEKIHFHEVGAVDSIVDIVAAAAGCHWLGIDRWLCSPLNIGGGHVHCAHGRFPVPAPATLELLRDLPIYSSGVQTELVTPTGAALLRALGASSSAFPAMSVQAAGYGAGSRDLRGQPNVLRLALGEASIASHPSGHPAGRPSGHPSNLGAAGAAAAATIGILETTIDDATPELLSYVAERLLASGAMDVYRTPVQMKKGRTGISLTVLCSPESASALQKMLFEQTTTLGVRYREEQRTTLARNTVSVETEWGPVRVKAGVGPAGATLNYAPEFEDCRSIAESHGVPLKQVMQAASAAYRARELRP